MDIGSACTLDPIAPTPSEHPASGYYCVDPSASSLRDDTALAEHITANLGLWDIAITCLEALTASLARVEQQLAETQQQVALIQARQDEQAAALKQLELMILAHLVSIRDTA